MHLLVLTLSPTDAIKRAQLFTVTMTGTKDCNFLHAIVIRRFLTVGIAVTRYVKARTHINFQIKTLEKYQISRSRDRTVFFPYQKKTTNIR